MKPDKQRRRAVTKGQFGRLSLLHYRLFTYHTTTLKLNIQEIFECIDGPLHLNRVPILEKRPLKLNTRQYYLANRVQFAAVLNRRFSVYRS